MGAVRPDAAYFWATHTGAELDLMLLKAGRRYGVELKFQDAPKLTPSMRIALKDLKLEHLTVVYPGDQDYPLAERVRVVPAHTLASGAECARIFLPGRPSVRERSRKVGGSRHIGSGKT
jgi:predicted AAA+ superfamily ATPase